MNKRDSQYRKVIDRYLEKIDEDLENAETEEEEHLSLYLKVELNSIINDVEVRGIGK